MARPPVGKNIQVSPEAYFAEKKFLCDWLKGLIMLGFALISDVSAMLQEPLLYWTSLKDLGWSFLNASKSSPRWFLDGVLEKDLFA